MSDTWQPISTAPRDGTKVIVREGTRICVAAFERPNFTPTAPEAWVLYVDYGHGLPGRRSTSTGLAAADGTLSFTPRIGSRNWARAPRLGILVGKVSR
jgi:hypothetical protein